MNLRGGDERGCSRQAVANSEVAPWFSCPCDSQAGFKRAMALVREEFLQRLDFYQHSWLPARALVEEALAQRFQVRGWEEALWLRG